MAPKAEDKEKKKKAASGDKTKDGKDPTAKKEKSSTKDASGKDTKHKSSKDGADGSRSASKDGKSTSRGQCVVLTACMASCRRHVVCSGGFSSGDRLRGYCSCVEARALSSSKTYCSSNPSRHPHHRVPHRAACAQGRCFAEFMGFCKDDHDLLQTPARPARSPRRTRRRPRR